MHAVQSRFDIRAIQTSWAKLDAMAQIRPIHDEAGYDRMVALMNDLLDVVGDNEEHQLAGLLELVGDLVSNYETGRPFKYRRTRQPVKYPCRPPKNICNTGRKTW